MRADDGVPEIEHTLETNDGTSATDPRNLTTNYTYNALADLGTASQRRHGYHPQGLARQATRNQYECRNARPLSSAV